MPSLHQSTPEYRAGSLSDKVVFWFGILTSDYLPIIEIHASTCHDTSNTFGARSTIDYGNLLNILVMLE